MRISRVLAALTVVALAAGCASTGGQSAPAAQQASVLQQVPAAQDDQILDSSTVADVATFAAAAGGVAIEQVSTTDRSRYWVNGSSPYSNILALQYLLNAHGNRTHMDGKYDKYTGITVGYFQKAHHLVADRSAGPITMRALVVTAKYGNPNKNTNKAIQQLLKKIGFKIAVDGSFGPDTRSKVMWYQQNRMHVKATGVVDATTWAWLFNPPPAPSVWSAAFMTAREDHSGIRWPLTTQQRNNAKFIIAVGKGHNVPAQGIKAALATAIVESWLYNRYRITDGTSGGLYQQQTSTGWGSYSQVRNKLLATKAFYGVASHTRNPGLSRYYPAYLKWSLGKTAQTVQRSAYPTRYQAQASLVNLIYNTYAGSVAPYRG